MELAVEPLCRRLAEDVGDDYRTLRALRPLLFASPEELLKSEVVGVDVDYWLVGHLLIQVSRPVYRGVTWVT